MGIVTKRINNKKNIGSIKVEGKEIFAISENEEIIEEGTKIVITNIIEDKAFVVEFDI